MYQFISGNPPLIQCVALLFATNFMPIAIGPWHFDHVCNAQHYSHWRNCCYYFRLNFVYSILLQSNKTENSWKCAMLNAFCRVYLMRLFSIFDNFVIWAHWKNTNDSYCNVKRAGRGGWGEGNSIIEGNPSMDRVWCIWVVSVCNECTLVWLEFWIWHITHHTVIMLYWTFLYVTSICTHDMVFGLWCSP